MATAQLSQIAKVGLGSPTTRVSAVNVVGTTPSTVNYTAPAGVPVTVNIIAQNVNNANNSTISVDGASFFALPIGTSASNMVSFSYSLAPGQATAITVTNATGGTTALLVSVKRSE